MPLQNGPYLTNDIFKHIFVTERIGNLMQISLKNVSYCSIGNNLALIRVMAWRRSGAKPLPEPMMNQFTDAYMRHQAWT